MELKTRSVPDSWTRFVAAHHAAGEAQARKSGLALPDRVAVLELAWLRTADEIGNDPTAIPDWFEELVVVESMRRSKLAVPIPLTASTLNTLDIATTAWERSVHASGTSLARVVEDNTAQLADRGYAIPLRDAGEGVRDLNFDCAPATLRVRVFPALVTGTIDGDFLAGPELVSWSGIEPMAVDTEGRFSVERQVDRAVAVGVTTPAARYRTEWFLG
ncbi:MAG: hypothetical protein QNJ77_15210 [Acidimicrobiia bacterium]|nr:hypothetical protein [Acidimicrobiia bacterium]